MTRLRSTQCGFYVFCPCHRHDGDELKPNLWIAAAAFILTVIEKHCSEHEVHWAKKGLRDIVCKTDPRLDHWDLFAVAVTFFWCPVSMIVLHFC